MSEPEGRGAPWTEERGRSDEGRRRLKSAPETSGQQRTSDEGRRRSEGGMGRRAGPRRRAGDTVTRIPAPQRLRVAYVLGTTAGGTGRHVAMLAAGCAARGLPVTVFGPADTERRFFHDRGGSAAVSDADPPRSWKFVRMEITDRPRPARDTAAVLRLRRLLLGASPDVVHAHGLRAGAIAALALAGAPRRRSALLVTVHNA